MSSTPSGPPRMSEEERRRWRRFAERDGWRIDEGCECAEPQVVLPAGRGYYLSLMCERCKRRVRRARS